MKMRLKLAQRERSSTGYRDITSKMLKSPKILFLFYRLHYRLSHNANFTTKKTLEFTANRSVLKDTILEYLGSQIYFRTRYLQSQTEYPSFNINIWQYNLQIILLVGGKER